MPLASYQGLGEPRGLVEFLSTASTALTLTQDQQSKLLIWNGQAGAARINLPAPEAGLTYRLFFNALAVSSATKIIANATGPYDILMAGAAAGTTGVAVAIGTTGEYGKSLELVAINETRWAAFQTYASSVDSQNLESTTT